MEVCLLFVYVVVKLNTQYWDKESLDSLVHVYVTELWHYAKTLEWKRADYVTELWHYAKTLEWKRADYVIFLSENVKISMEIKQRSAELVTTLCHDFQHLYKPKTYFKTEKN